MLCMVFSLVSVVHGPCIARLEIKHYKSVIRIKIRIFSQRSIYPGLHHGERLRYLNVRVNIYNNWHSQKADSSLVLAKLYTSVNKVN